MKKKVDVEKTQWLSLKIGQLEKTKQGKKENKTKEVTRPLQLERMEKR